MNEAIRQRLHKAADALCNWEQHVQLWRFEIRLNPDEDTFDDVVLFLTDELSTDRPDELVGHFLLDDEELSAFVRLTTALEALMRECGGLGSLDDALKTGPIWEECQAAACHLRVLMGEAYE